MASPAWPPPPRPNDRPRLIPWGEDPVRPGAATIRSTRASAWGPEGNILPPGRRDAWGSAGRQCLPGGATLALADVDQLFHPGR